MSGYLEEATRAFRRTEATLKKRRVELAAAIVRAHSEGWRQVDIVKVTGYTREHISRIVDAANKS